MARLTKGTGCAEFEKAIGRFTAVSYANGNYCGYGSGYGYGYGDGSGYGSGDGSGYGYGDGSGYGYGSGSGSGSGSGDGYGDGSGYGITSFCGDPVRKIDDIQTVIYRIHGNVASGAILRNDLTTEKCYVAKGGDFFAHGKTIREAQAALEAKIMEDMPIEDRIWKFRQTFMAGKKYPAKDFYNWHHALTGSCEMGRNEFAREHAIDIEKDMMTPEEFIRLTENAYGGAVIRQLKAEMEKA